MWEQKKAGKNTRWEKPYTATQGGISSCLCKHCWGQWSFAAVKQPQLRSETAFILLLSSMVSLPAQVMYPGNGQNALQTNLCPGKSTSVDSQLEKFTSCFSKQEYITAWGSPALQSPRILGCVFKVLCGCPTGVAQVSSYDPSWRWI